MFNYYRLWLFSSVILKSAFCISWRKKIKKRKKDVGGKGNGNKKQTQNQAEICSFLQHWSQRTLISPFAKHLSSQLKIMQKYIGWPKNN